MAQHRFTHLIGKDKKQILVDFGQEFNYYPSDQWTYELKKNWLGKRKFLILVFKNDTVVSSKIKTQYGNFNFNKL